VDPGERCPFCDSPLLAQPTAILTKLKENIESKRLNSRSCKAPSSAMWAPFCARHSFESTMLPKAEKQGWPKTIDWEGLKGRVREMRNDLTDIVNDAGDPIIYGNDNDGDKKKELPKPEAGRKKGPRMQCIPWSRIVAKIAKKGRKAIKGVTADYQCFDETQPGYYGEVGSHIIVNILYDMLPPKTIDADLVKPLTPEQFLLQILLPEVGMRLIVQDLSLNLKIPADKEKAVGVMRDSAVYGVTMFPLDETDSPNAGEEIVIERAQQRRREIEIEEREE
ncbi:hypothetical protein FB451DRAFT_959645, partial [Mycena latifolia]